MHKNNLLLVSSALLYAISFLFPAYCFWGVFVFLLPLLYCTSSRFSFSRGFIWGMVFWSIVLLGVWQFLYAQTQTLMAATAASCFLVCYLSFWSGVWFCCIRSPISFIVATWLYIAFVWRGIIFIFGAWQGIPIVYPLLPLAQYPPLLYTVPFFGAHVLTLIIILFQWCIAHNKKIAALVCAIPFLVGFGMSRKITRPPWLERVVYVHPTHLQGSNQWQARAAITKLLAKARTQCPKADCFIFPESAFPYTLDDVSVAMWYDVALRDTDTVVIGAYCKEGDHVFNSCFILHGRRITHRYDKINLFPFTEEIPCWWGSFLSVRHLFVKKWRPLSCGATTAICLPLTSDVVCTPKICSELFFTDSFDTTFDCPLLCIANDGWFGLSYMQRLLYLHVQLKSRMWQKPIMYCSYRYGVYIEQGTMIL